MIPYNSEGRWGYCDNNGTIKIRPDWDDAGLFHNGLARVSIGSADIDPIASLGLPVQYALIDTAGRYIIPFSRGWTGQWMNDTAQFEARRTEAVTRSRARYRSRYPMRFGDLLNARDSKTRLWGMIDSSNRVIIPFLFDKQAFSLVRNRQTGRCYVLGSQKGRFGVCDPDGTVRVPFIHPQLEYEPADTAGISIISYRYVKDTQYCKLIDPEWNDRIDGEFSMLRYENGRWIGTTRGDEKSPGRYGVFASDGRVILPLDTRWVIALDDIFKIKRSKLIGNVFVSADSAIDRDGNPVRPPEYDYQPDYRLQHSGNYYPIPSAKIFNGDSFSTVVNFGSQRGHVVHNLNERSFEPPVKKYFLAAFGSGVYAVVTDSGRMVMKPQRYEIINFVGRYLQAFDSNRRPFLMDTLGRRISVSIDPNLRITGILKDRNGRQFLLAGGYVDHLGGCGTFEHRKPNDLKGFYIVDDKGAARMKFGGSHSARTLYADERTVLGRMDLIRLRTQEGFEGLITPAGDTVYPQLSFRYKKMDLVCTSNELQDANSATLRNGGKPRPSRLRGCFMVRNESGHLGYFKPDGKAPFPALNFRFDTPLQQFGDRLWYASQTGIGTRFVDDNNADATAIRTFGEVSRDTSDPRLIRITLTQNRTIFAGDNGRFFCDPSILR